MIWKLFGNTRPADLGFIPDFLDDEDPRSAKEQFHENYSHGGGWSPMDEDVFAMGEDGRLLNIKYHEDPDLPVLAESKLRNEVIRFYDYAWVAIVQPDGSFEVSRLD